VIRESIVRLEIAADHGQVRLARLVAAGVATSQGFDIEAVEDLRIAVDEGCIWLIAHSDSAPLQLTFLAADGGVEVRGETPRGSQSGVEPLGGLAERILAASCTRYNLEVGESVAVFTIVSDADRGAAPHRDGP
jgi:serine/threonine-protein kinase RsbW